jgi:small subunit ribosomal protein S17
MPRKTLDGRVVSDKMLKTVVVAVETTTRHRLYNKVMRRTKKYIVHDEADECQMGDWVRIEECRPMSARKRFKVIEILRHGGVVADA